MQRHSWRRLQQALALARAKSEPPNIPDEALLPVLQLQCGRCPVPFKVGDIIICYPQTTLIYHLDCMTAEEVRYFFRVGGSL